MLAAAPAPRDDATTPAPLPCPQRAASSFQEALQRPLPLGRVLPARTRFLFPSWGVPNIKYHSIVMKNNSNPPKRPAADGRAKWEQSGLAVTLRGQGRQGSSIHSPALPLVLAGVEGKVTG